MSSPSLKTPSKKGRYIYCVDCDKYNIEKGKYPCSLSHKQIRTQEIDFFINSKDFFCPYYKKDQK